MTKLVLSKEEKDKLLQGVDEAKRRLSEWEGELTEEDARLLLKETLQDALVLVLKNHKKERLLT
jgi:hypothetical protein